MAEQQVQGDGYQQANMLREGAQVEAEPAAEEAAKPVDEQVALVGLAATVGPGRAEESRPKMWQRRQKVALVSCGLGSS
jgi:hypothetical protein